MFTRWIPATFVIFALAFLGLHNSYAVENQIKEPVLVFEFEYTNRQNHTVEHYYCPLDPKEILTDRLDGLKCNKVIPPYTYEFVIRPSEAGNSWYKVYAAQVDPKTGFTMQFALGVEFPNEAPNIDWTTLGWIEMRTAKPPFLFGVRYYRNRDVFETVLRQLHQKYEILTYQHE